MKTSITLFWGDPVNKAALEGVATQIQESERQYSKVFSRFQSCPLALNEVEGGHIVWAKSGAGCAEEGSCSVLLGYRLKHK